MVLVSHGDARAYAVWNEAGAAARSQTAKGQNYSLSHIVGISMDPQGVPMRLFATDRWITPMIQLFRPQIMKLPKARNRRVVDWATTHPSEDVYVDRDLDVKLAIDILID